MILLHLLLHCIQQLYYQTPDAVPITPVHSIIFDVLDGPVIRAATLQTSGAARPSGIDAHG